MSSAGASFGRRGEGAGDPEQFVREFVKPVPICSLAQDEREVAGRRALQPL